MTKPLVTIGITCYSEGEWLRDCWEGVLAQNDGRWEAVIVMDGGANEETQKVFVSLSHPKLRKVALDRNVGCHNVHNIAFEQTVTPYHFYVDGDDKLLPSSVGLVLDGFTRRPDSYCVYGKYLYFGEKTGTTSVLMGACAYRKDVWAALGGFDAELTVNKGDLDFHISAQEAGFSPYYIGNPFYAIRVHSASISEKRHGTSWREHEVIVKRHPAYFADRERKLHFLYQGYKRAFEYYCSISDFRSAVRIYRHSRSRGIVICDPMRLLEIKSPSPLRFLVRQFRFKCNGFISRIRSSR